MDSLHTMRVFARVAQRESFAAAARELRMSPASVTKHVAAVEARVGARLLDRTTRRVRVTEAGQAYLARCLACLALFDEAEAVASGYGPEPRGTLRVAAPHDFDRHLPALVAGFLARHPLLGLDVRLSNRTLDMVDEDIDVYVRVSNTLPADAVARPLATTRLAVWGVPAYFARHGRPGTPEDLARHRFALFDEPPLVDDVTLRRGDEVVHVRLQPAIVANSGDYLVASVLAGACLGVLPSFILGDTLPRVGEVVLPDWDCGRRLVSAVFPHRRYVPAKVSAFVAELRRELGDGSRDPWWPDDVRPPAALQGVDGGDGGI